MAVLEEKAITVQQIMDMLPATFTKRGLTEAEYFDLCAKFDDAFVEYTPDGTVIIMPLTDPETSQRVIDVVSQLNHWAQEDGRGFVTGPDGGFLFPSGARRGPDAAWINKQRWKEA